MDNAALSAPTATRVVQVVSTHATRMQLKILCAATAACVGTTSNNAMQPGAETASHVLAPPGNQGPEKCIQQPIQHPKSCAIQLK
jgi:hypothetical protein